MNFLVVTSLYTGMLPSLAAGRYAPCGVPAYHKLLERLSAEGIAVTALVLAKSPAASAPFPGMTERTFPELPGVRFVVVPFYGRFLRHGSLAERANEAVQLLVFAKTLLRQRPDLVYADRASLKAAALASLAGFRTVVRFLGVANFPALAASVRARLLSPLTWLGLFARYDLILCTEDGSPSRAFFERSRNRRTPVLFALNGVDAVPGDAADGAVDALRRAHGFAPGTPVALFVGRPSPDKGALDLLDALAALRRRGTAFGAVFVCGAPGDALRREAAARGLGDAVAVRDAVPHRELAAYYRMADVYVSLNRFGNLSNTVLEALRAGVCTVLLGPNRRDGTDAATELLVPPEAAARVDRDNLAAALQETLHALLTRPELRRGYAAQAAALSRRLLCSWEERLDAEAALLRLVAGGGAVTPQAAAGLTARGAAFLPPRGT